MGNSIFVGGYGREQERFAVFGSKKEEAQQEGKQRKSIYAGDLFRSEDPVSQRFARRKKEALDTLLEQFRRDMETDDEMREHTEHAETLGDTIRQATKQIEGVDQRRAEIQERYGVAADSQEQKDLELMQKANAAQEHPFDEAYQLTQEEKDRLAAMPPATAYQQEMLECDEEEKMYRTQRENAQMEALVDTETVHATKKALLKVHPMADAKAASKKIMQNALKDLAYGLAYEAKGVVDEKMQETREQMAENKEEALEEKIEQEKAKEEDAEREQLQEELDATVLSTEMQATSVSQKAMDNLQSNVKSLIQEQVLLDVDLKGLKVNKQV